MLQGKNTRIPLLLNIKLNLFDMIKPWKKGIISILLLSSLLCVECTNDKVILANIESLQSQPIDLCISDLTYIDKDNLTSYYENDKDIPFRLVIFTGANECSTCALNSLSDWNILLNLEKEKKVQLVFILSPRKDKFEHVISTYYSSNLEHPILIDTCDVFIHRNPHIPTECLYHTFLLDSENNVIMVGNPIKNSKIQKILEDIIK